MEEDKILSRFSPKYKEKLNLNPMYRTIYELLLSGVDEYSLIENLLEANENWAIALTKLQEQIMENEMNKRGLWKKDRDLN